LHLHLLKFPQTFNGTGMIPKGIIKIAKKERWMGIESGRSISTTEKLVNGRIHNRSNGRKDQVISILTGAHSW
jgi:hypothetical protein